MQAYKRPQGVVCCNRFISIGKGRRLRLLIAKPEGQKDGEKAVGVLWMHGGGYMNGSPELIFASRAIDLVTKGGAVVIAPAYTLSPAAPYPAAVSECHRALVYIKQHADELGIRSDKIMVGGESAGGGLCAAVCMYAKDHGTVNVAFQMPLYPMLDCYDTDSSRDNHEKGWNTRKNHIAWRLYLRSLKYRRIPCYASPARRRDYRGLPPCYTFVGSVEPFYRETLEYVERLKRAGVPAHADVYEGCYHEFDMAQPNDPMSIRAAEVFIEQFLLACEKYSAPQRHITDGN